VDNSLQIFGFNESNAPTGVLAYTLAISDVLQFIHSDNPYPSPYPIDMSLWDPKNYEIWLASEPSPTPNPIIAPNCSFQEKNMQY
jgi:hypothetical protein